MTLLPSSTPRPDLGRPAAVAEHDAALRALLASIVDYAGLFPPAGLDMQAAARAYDEYRRGDRAWMLGSFVVPSGRIEELATAVATHASTLDRWPLSVLVPSMDEAARVMGSLSPAPFELQALEMAPVPPAAIRSCDALCDAVGHDVDVYWEIPLDQEMETRLDAVARVGAAAKVRTGGVHPHAFPTAAHLAGFIAGCARRGVAFKATAGLHHPLRGRYPLTYDASSASCDMFGFLDVALVAELLWLERIDVAEAADLLAMPGKDVAVEADTLLFAGHRSSVRDLQDFRREFFHSFGSCSFGEPVADLIRLGLL